MEGHHLITPINHVSARRPEEDLGSWNGLCHFLNAPFQHQLSSSNLRFTQKTPCLCTSDLSAESHLSQKWLFTQCLSDQFNGQLFQHPMSLKFVPAISVYNDGTFLWRKIMHRFCYGEKGVNPHPSNWPLRKRRKPFGAVRCVFPLKGFQGFFFYSLLPLVCIQNGCERNAWPA